MRSIAKSIKMIKFNKSPLLIVGKWLKANFYTAWAIVELSSCILFSEPGIVKCALILAINLRQSGTDLGNYRRGNMESEL